MNRKSWNRLRKERPELFVHIQYPHSWERLGKSNRLRVKRCGKKEAIARLTANALTLL